MTSCGRIRLALGKRGKGNGVLRRCHVPSFFPYCLCGDICVVATPWWCNYVADAGNVEGRGLEFRQMCVGFLYSVKFLSFKA